MIRLRKQTKFIIIILVIAFSVYLGLRRSNLMNTFTMTKQPVDIEKAKKIFSNKKNSKKITLEYKVTNFDKIENSINEVLKSTSSKKLYADYQNRYRTYLMEIPDSSYFGILSELRSSDNVINENLQNAPGEGFETNIKANVKNQIIAKNRIQELINKSTSPERMKLFRIQLEKIQTKIDSLENQISQKKHNSENALLLLKVISDDPGSSLKSSIRTFFITTFILLIVMVIILFVFYYFILLMIKLMKIVGIRTSRGSSSNYNYNYNKNYGRKVKRVYKDKKNNKKNNEDKK